MCFHQGELLGCVEGVDARIHRVHALVECLHGAVQLLHNCLDVKGDGKHLFRSCSHLGSGSGEINTV